MKRNLLMVASLFFGASAFAQFTNDNAPQIGDGMTLYRLDTLAPAYGGVTGSGVTWDYSTTLGFKDDTRTVTVLDASTTGNAASFGTSTVAQEVEGFLMSYTTSVGTGRESQGFVFTEPSFGEVVAVFDTDPAQYYNYPMDVSSPAIYDTYEGQVNSALGTSSMTGKLEALVDGEGTLKLWGNDYTNVLRYKIIDTMDVLGIPVLGDIQMTRVQYEYYDLANGNLPIFVHTNVIFGQPGGVPMNTTTLVLSKDETTQYVSVSENVLEQTTVYPNPASEIINIQLPSSIETANVVITDALGREVYTATLNATLKTIDVSKMNKGMYFVNISNDSYSTTKSVVVK